MGRPEALPAVPEGTRLREIPGYNCQNDAGGFDTPARGRVQALADNILVPNVGEVTPTSATKSRGEDVNRLLRYFRAVPVSAGAEESDHTLLARFVRDRDGAAFSALVVRHSGAVWAACRRLLDREQDAEDAFQAVFLTLARKAGSVRESLPAWLHGVARRVAANLRRTLQRQRTTEQTVRVPEAQPADITWREGVAVLDEELAHLPERYRTVLILCCLAGRSRDEVAHQLGCGEGRVKGLLERGRELLRRRLARRGFELGAVLLGAGVAGSAVSAPALPAVFIEACLRLAHGSKVGNNAPPAAVALSEQVVRAMFVRKLKTVTALVVTVLAVGGAFAYRAAEEEPVPAGTNSPPALTDTPVPKALGKGADDQSSPRAAADPLPKGATARLGSTAFRRPYVFGGVWFSADGERLFSCDSQQMIGWDANTGKRLENSVFPVGQKFIGWHPVFAGERLITFVEERSPDLTRRLLARTAVVTGPDGKVVSRIDCTSLTLGNISPTAPGTFAVARTGTRAAHVSDDRTVRAFDLTTGKELFKEKFGPGPLTGVVLAPDGNTLFVQEGTKDLRRFSLPDGKELPPLAVGEGPLAALVVSADGSRAVSQLSVWEKTPGGGRALNQTSFALIHDLTTGKVIGNLEVGGRPEPGPMIGSEAILIVSRTYRPPGPPAVELARWNLKTKTKEWELADDSSPILSPDGKRLALVSQASIRIFDPATGKRLDPMVAHPYSIGRIEFSGDGETVTTWCRSARMTWTLTGERKTVSEAPELWDGRGDGQRRDIPWAWLETAADGKSGVLAGGQYENRKDAWRIPIGSDIPEWPLTHDGKRVIAAVFDSKEWKWNVSVFDGPAGKKLSSWTVAAPPGAQVHPAGALSGDGKTLFGFDGDVVGRDPETGKELVRVKTGPVAVFPVASFPAQLATTADGARIAVVRRSPRESEQTLRLFDVKTGKELAAYDLGSAYVHGLVFDRTGSQVAVWNHGAQVMLYPAEKRTEPRKLDRGSVSPSCVAFSPNGASLAVGYLDGTALLWDLTAK
jgi:RNA polymerase sigma factor (sigma-70 family)